MVFGTQAARRYAKAIYELAADNGCVEAVMADLAGIDAAVRASPDLGRFLSSYVRPKAERARALSALFETRCHPLMWRAIRFLESKRRLGLLPAIHAAVVDRHDRVCGRVRAGVRSAFALAPNDMDAIRSWLSRQSPGTPVLTSFVDSALIGGCIVTVEDRQYDGSIRGALERMRRALTSG